MLEMAAIVGVGVLLWMHQNHKFAQLQASQLTLEDVKAELGSTKKLIKDSIKSKQAPTYYTDSSEVTEVYINSLRDKYVLVYDDMNYNFIWNLAKQVYGEDHICVDAVYQDGNKFHPIAYKLYVR